MKDHWHKVYIRQTVAQVVELLRGRGIAVDYNPVQGLHAGARVEHSKIVISSCINNRMLSMPVPDQAMACVELLSSTVQFSWFRGIVEKHCDVVQDCPCTK
jgi:hypothetical protein